MNLDYPVTYSSIFFSTCSGADPLGISGTGLRFLLPDVHPVTQVPTHSVKAENKTQSSHPNQWPRFNLSSFTAGLLTESALLPTPVPAQ